MERLDIRRLKTILNIKGNYFAMAVAFVIMLLVYPVEGKFKYSYKKGAPWTYEDLTAPIDFPILKTQQELSAEKNAAAGNVVPYYISLSSVVNRTITELSESCIKNGINSDTLETLRNSLKKVYEVGVLPLKEVSDKAVFVRNGRTNNQVIESDLFTPDKAVRQMKSDLLAEYPHIEADSLFDMLRLNDIVSPNLSFDKKTTDELHRMALDYISPTKGMFYAGQTIVVKGETVTADIAQLLDSYKAEYKKSVGFSGNMAFLYAGHALVLIVLLFLIYLVVYFSDQGILRKQNQFNFIMFLTCLNFVLPMLVRKVSPDLLYIVPLAVTTLYIAAFMFNRVVLPLYMVSILPVMIIAENGVELYMINAVAGAVALFATSVNDKGWVQFLNGLYIFLATAVVHIGFSLFNSGNFGDINTMLYLLISAFLVVICFPITFLLEKMFYMVSSSTMRDLSDLDNHVLRELERKAPGTFQHCLHVANLAERAAAAVGCRTRVARAGALYHDIGKMTNPQAFIENQAPGVNYHAGLTAKESAAVIIKHVDDGLELARKFKIPAPISDFISSHHAHSVTGYFYNVYCNEGGNPDDKGDFTYKGMLPKTKEQVIVMMADAVEAASRSLKEYSEENISAIVDNVISNRLSFNELSDADITFKEIATIKKVFKKQLQEVYHTRIAYPKRNNP
ncbi:MAG: HD family phosphohydrolase [Candidatus Egerieousia sp.]